MCWNSNAGNVFPSQTFSFKRTCLVTSARESLWETLRSSERFCVALARVKASTKSLVSRPKPHKRAVAGSSRTEPVPSWYIQQHFVPDVFVGGDFVQNLRSAPWILSRHLMNCLGVAVAEISLTFTAREAPLKGLAEFGPGLWDWGCYGQSLNTQ